MDPLAIAEKVLAVAKVIHAIIEAQVPPLHHHSSLHFSNSHTKLYTPTIR